MSRRLIEFVDKASREDLEELLPILDEAKHSELISFLLSYLSEIRQIPG